MKEIKVIIAENARKEIEQLNNVVNQEITKGVKSSENQTLLNSIKQKIEFLKKDPEYGIHIAKNKIPREYITNYDVNNIWKINLSRAWRMIYTIKGSEIEILSIIIDILNHKKYSKKFGYKK
jgi:hypothetical protein